jgi:hypothetical protein
MPGNTVAVRGVEVPADSLLPNLPSDSLWSASVEPLVEGGSADLNFRGAWWLSSVPCVLKVVLKSSDDMPFPVKVGMINKYITLAEDCLRSENLDQNW